jgi:hypothetical protein
MDRNFFFIFISLRTLRLCGANTTRLQKVLGIELGGVYTLQCHTAPVKPEA